MKKLIEYTLLELKILFRVPIFIFFTMLFPILMLTIFVLSSKNPIIIDDIRFVDVYLPAMMLLSLFSSGITSIAVIVAGNRGNNVWQIYRLRGFKISELFFVTMFVNIFLSFISCLFLVIFSNITFQAKLPPLPNLISFIMIWFIVAIAIFMIGFLIGVFCKSEKIAQSISTPLMFILMVVSGIMVNERDFPQLFQNIFSCFPSNQANKMLVSYWTGIDNSQINWWILIGWIVISAIIVFIKLYKDDYKRG